MNAGEVHASRSARPWATGMVLRLDEVDAYDKTASAGFA
jgi:hypothetical protein